MKTLMEIIKLRKSIRAYQDKPLPKQVVRDILEAAKYAPTARNMQELEYRVITSKTLMDKLSKGIVEAIQKEGLPLKGPPGAKPEFFHGAPLLILVIAPSDNMWSTSNAALAVQNILLYTTSIELGACFVGMAKLIEKDKELCKLVHIPDSMTIVAAVICGYPAEDPAPREKKQTVEFFE